MYARCDDDTRGYVPYDAGAVRRWELAMVMATVRQMMMSVVAVVRGCGCSASAVSVVMMMRVVSCDSDGAG